MPISFETHRKTAPTNDDEYLKSLTEKDQSIVSQLCALLRLADAIEISHTSRIQEVKLKNAKARWQLELVGEGNLLLERWALEKRKALFEDVFGIRLEVLE